MNISNELVKAHFENGRLINVNGVKGFVREEGQGEPVVCLHGVPSSSFLYRKVITELADNGYRGIAFDFPGMGLSEKPAQFDYSWTGLGKWSIQATEAFGLDKFHLIIHDIGGPVGMEILAAHPERILSLTILNTLAVGISKFIKPWMMRPFEWKGVGEIFLGTLVTPAFKQLMYHAGVKDKSVFGTKEAGAYVELLKRADNGKAFLKIMRSFETTKAKEELYTSAIKNLNVPKQMVWGKYDNELTVKKYAIPIQEQLGVEKLHLVNGKHFLQEDCAKEIVQHFIVLNQ